MTKAEIEELLELTGWSKAFLAESLDLSENIIYQWCSGRRKPGGPANILMRQWLTQSRSQTNKKPGRRKELALAK